MELEGVPSSKSDFVRFKGWRVMVIEDDPVVAKSIEMSLRSMGVSVEHFFNAEDALAAYPYSTQISTSPIMCFRE